MAVRLPRCFGIGRKIKFDALSTPGPMSPGGGLELGDRQRNADVTMYHQQTANWCWAAVTQATVKHYNQLALAQEAVATRHMQSGNNVGTVCTIAPAQYMPRELRCEESSCPRTCTSTHGLPQVMASFELELEHFDKDNYDFDKMYQITQDGGLIPVFINFSSGPHFVCVTNAYRDKTGEPYVNVLDPWPVSEKKKKVIEDIMPYNSFLKYSKHGSSGSASYIFLVQKL